MGISVKSLYELTKDKYKIKLISGEKGIGNEVRWMYFMENMEVVNFLYGREFIITTGFAMDNEEWILNLTKKLVERKACGLILNTGKYIKDIPDELIKYSNENSFPIFTIPWEIHISDIVKDYCIKIFLSDKTEESVSDALNNIIFNNSNDENHIQAIEDAGFNINGKYAMALIEPDFSTYTLKSNESDSKIIKQNIKLSMMDTFNSYFETYNIIEKNNFYLIVIKSSHINLIEESLQKSFHVIKELFNIKCWVGLVNNIVGIENLNIDYVKANAALFMAKRKKLNLVIFDQMGIYRAILTGNNKDILIEIYYEQLGKLIDYDKKYNTDLKETFKMYLLNNKSIQAVSQESYLHRNTVNYRIKKIKEILQCNLEKYEDIFAYQLAFFIEEIM